MKQKELQNKNWETQKFLKKKKKKKKSETPKTPGQKIREPRKLSRGPDFAL